MPHIGWTFILYNLLVLMVFTTIYFLVREYFRIKENKLTIKQTFFIGIILGVMAMLVEMFVSVWYPGIDRQFLTIIPLYIIIFAIMFDSRFALYMGVFALFGILLRIPIYQNATSGVNELATLEVMKHSILEFISIISVIIIVTICQTINLFKNSNKQPKKVIYIFNIWMIIFEILIILIYGLEQIGYEVFIVTKIIYPFFFFLFYFITMFLLQYIFVFLIERIYTNSDILETFSTKDDVSYYKLSLSQQTIKQNIMNNKTSMGLMILFYLDEVPQLKKEEILIKIRDQFSSLNQNAIFFKATNKSYASFLPMKLDFKSLHLIYKNNLFLHRTKSDPLFQIDKIVNKLNYVDYNISCGISIYGIHSNNIVDLISKSEMILGETSRLNNQTKTIVYDYRRIRDNLVNNAKIANLSNIISNRKDSFIASLNFKNYYYVLHYFKINEKHFYLDQVLENLNHNDALLLQRFLAYQTLRSCKTRQFKKLILPYPIEFLNNKDFHVEKIIKRIAKQIPLNQIILEFDSNLLIQSETVSIALKKLRASGIEFSICNAEKANKKNTLFIKPNYYMFTKMVYFKKALIEGRPEYRLKFKLDAKEIK